jgi:hypothetical protein
MVTRSQLLVWLDVCHLEGLAEEEFLFAVNIFGLAATQFWETYIQVVNQLQSTFTSLENELERVGINFQSECAFVSDEGEEIVAIAEKARDHYLLLLEYNDIHLLVQPEHINKWFHHKQSIQSKTRYLRALFSRLRQARFSQRINYPTIADIIRDFPSTIALLSSIKDDLPDILVDVDLEFQPQEAE